MDYFAHDLQSFDFLGLNVGAQSFNVPEVQNIEQQAAPPRLDVRPNREPMDHDQAIDVPTPQTSLPLTDPVEMNTDNGDNT